MKQPVAPALYGLMAEFGSSTDLVVATRAAYAAGYRKMDAYSPFPIEEASEALGFHKTRVPLIVLVGALFGGLRCFALQYWINVISYPLNIGGRPWHSWPAFIVPTFEMTVLVDDNSQDDSVAIARRAALAVTGSARDSDRVRIFSSPRRNGKPSSLNIGIRMARGQFIAIVDADTILQYRYVQHWLMPFNDPAVGEVAKCRIKYSYASPSKSSP